MIKNGKKKNVYYYRVWLDHFMYRKYIEISLSKL